MKREKHDRKNYLSKRELIEIQSEAFYKALKRIEFEKNKTENIVVEEFSKKEKLLAVLNALICPKKIKNKYIKDSGITDSLFAMISSLIMSLTGQVIRVIGLLILISSIAYVTTTHKWIYLFLGFVFGILCFMLGILFVWSGDEIEKEKDSSKINIYTSNVLALIGLIVAVIAFIN